MARWRNTNYNLDAPQSPRASLSADGRNRLSRRVHVEWDGDSLAQASDDFLGYPILRTGKVGARLVKYISRVTPHPYPYRFTAVPEYSNAPVLFCVGFDPTAQGTSGTGTGANGDAYGKGTHAAVDLTYDTLTYDVIEDNLVQNLGDALPDPFPHDANDSFFRHITPSWRPAGKVLSLGSGMMRVRDDADATKRIPIKEGIPVNIPAVELSYTWHQVPEAGIPTATMQVTQGAINSVAFDGFTAETLLLLSIDLRRYRHPVGVRVVDITYKMKWLPNVDPADGLPKGHNFVYRVVGGQLVLREVTSNGQNTGTRTFRKLPFKPLFRPPQ